MYLVSLQTLRFPLKSEIKLCWFQQCLVAQYEIAIHGAPASFYALRDFKLFFSYILLTCGDYVLLV